MIGLRKLKSRRDLLVHRIPPYIPYVIYDKKKHNSLDEKIKNLTEEIDEHYKTDSDNPCVLEKIKTFKRYREEKRKCLEIKEPEIYYSIDENKQSAL